MNKEQVTDELKGSDWDDIDISKLNIDPKHKFLNRDRTIPINITRLYSWIPEHLKEDKKILDVSCGSGASLEVIRCSGADGTGLEFSPKSKTEEALHPDYYKDVNSYSNYEPLLRSQNLNYVIHDCSKVPYPFEDSSFDVVLNYGAITFYGDPDYWTTILDEFKRLSKDVIVVGVNVGWKWDIGEAIIDEWSKKQDDLELIAKYRSTYKWKFKKL